MQLTDNSQILDKIKDKDLQRKIRFLFEKIQNPRSSYMAVGAEFFKHSFNELAMEYFERANAIEADHLSLYNIGCLHYSNKQYKKAIINLEKSKSMNESFFMSHLVAGLCYSMMSNIKAAESNFITVLMSDPGNETALTALSIMYYNQGKLGDSLKLIDYFKTKSGQSIKLNKLKSNILYETGKLKELVEEIKKDKKTDDNYRIYDDYIESIKVQVFTDKYGSLNQKIDKLQSDSEENKKNLISLSLCHLFSGDTEKAIDYLFKAKELI